MSFGDFIKKVQEFTETPLFTVGEKVINVSSIILFLLIVFAFVIIARIIARQLVLNILTRMRIVEGTRYTIRRITEYTIILVGGLIAFQTIGIDLSGLTVIFGLLSVGIGFGLQNITSNFVAGLMLLFERPISVGDRITIGDTEGDVMEINIRSTTVRSLNNISIIVPNSQFVSSQVVNWTHGDKRVRLDIPVGVSYDSDLDLVFKSLREVADEDANVLQTPEPEVNFREFGDSSWHMELHVWIADPKKHYQI